MKTYLTNTCRPSYSFIFSGVLLLLYEAGMLLFEDAGVRNGVDVWLDALLHILPGGTWVVSLLVLLLGVGFVVYDIQKGIAISLPNFIVMWLEFAIWALILWLNIGLIVGTIFPIANQVGGQGSWVHNIFLSFGAGFYEELFFRLLLVKAMEIGAQLAGYNPQFFATRAVIIGATAVLFSLAHFDFVIGSMGDAFDMYLFVFRTLFGMLMSGLLMFRGFGITAWTHALYDVLVFTFR